MPDLGRQPVEIPEAMTNIWGRLPTETSKAFAAFLHYLRLSPIVRSVERAYRVQAKIDPETPVEIPVMWRRWCSKYHWLRRAKAYDDMVFGEELEKWEKRRNDARERDWEQAQKLRDIVDGALPSATQFFTRRVGQPQGGTPRIVNEQGQVIQEGTPAQVIVTVAFNVADMTMVLEKASKLQRLTLNEPTDNINNLTGAALDAALSRALAQWALDNVSDSNETGNAQGVDEPDAYSDGGDWQEPDEEMDD